jgi:predicted ATPase
MVDVLLSQAELEDLLARDGMDPVEVTGVERLARDRVTAIEAWLNELTPSPIGSLAVERAPTGEVIFAADDTGGGSPLTARSLSDGTVRFAALALVLLGESRRRTLLIEEIENGIHPARADLVLRMLEASRDPNTQVICTTHSPALLKAASRATAMDALVVGWDLDSSCSHVAQVRDLPDIQKALRNADLGELQSDGWIQFAAAV